MAFHSSPAARCRKVIAIFISGSMAFLKLVSFLVHLGPIVVISLSNISGGMRRKLIKDAGSSCLSSGIRTAKWAYFTYIWPRPNPTSPWSWLPPLPTLLIWILSIIFASVSSSLHYKCKRCCRSIKLLMLTLE